MWQKPANDDVNKPFLARTGLRIQEGMGMEAFVGIIRDSEPFALVDADGKPHARSEATRKPDAPVREREVVSPAGSDAKADQQRHLSRQSFWAAMPKRVFDLTGAILGIALIAPLMLMIALLVYLHDRGPVFFAHKRIGKDGREFRCLKFRSMAVNSEQLLREYLASNPQAAIEWQQLHKLREDPRVTRIGKFMRVTSIDELPQLLNVVRGDMSLIGPRPIVADEIQKYGRYIADYCSVKPGMTGLWQVSGRNDTTYSRRVAIDVYYARHISMYLDMLIILKTFPAVVFGRGSS